MSLHIGGRDYQEFVSLDFEFCSDPPGSPLEVVSMAAHELMSGRRHQYFGDQLRQMGEAPFPVNQDSLVASYGATAEIECFLRLGWQLPVNVWCFYASFRRLTNGLKLTCPQPNSLIGALTYFREDAMASAAKESMRDLILRGNHTAEELRSIAEYNQVDVDAGDRLYPHLLRQLDDPLTWSRVLYDGEGMKAWAHVQNIGVPIDTEALEELRRLWVPLKLELIREVDADYGVFDGTVFRMELFEQYLNHNRFGWPRLASGRPSLEDETFRTMSRVYPELHALHQLRTALSSMRLESLSVGADARNRIAYFPLSANSGRCAPSSTKNIFGPSTWLRSLIRPEPERAIAVIDWSQQEFGISAWLSQDDGMIEAYTSGDAYLSFASRAGAIKDGMSPDQIRAVRDTYKAVTLGLSYGMGAPLLAAYTGRSLIEARIFIAHHKRLFPKFWHWSDAVEQVGQVRGQVWDVLGWPLRVGSHTKATTLKNFPIQASAYQLLRLALLMLIRRGVTVCATIHDSFMVEAHIGDIDEVVGVTQATMLEASRSLLGGFQLRSKATIVRYPDRFQDERGTPFWETVQRLVKRQRKPQTVVPSTAPPNDHEWYYPSTVHGTPAQ